MKRKYLGTFVSLQTGCAYSRSHFLDHPGDDARRILIFSTNQWHWRSIRDLVRQWVLGAYTTWQMLSPAWLNNRLRALISHPRRLPADTSGAAAECTSAGQGGGKRPTTWALCGGSRRRSLAARTPPSHRVCGSSESAGDSPWHDECAHYYLSTDSEALL